MGRRPPGGPAAPRTRAPYPHGPRPGRGGRGGGGGRGPSRGGVRSTARGGGGGAGQGDGVIKIEMHFLPDVYVTCETCKGARYNRETLEIRFKGKSIADVLDMTVEDAQGFFKAVPSIREKMDALMRVGLG